VVRQIELQDWMRGQEKTHPLKLLGIEPYFPEIPPVVGELVEGRAAQAQGMQPGDRVVAVNGVEILTWKEWVELIRQNPGVSMQVLVDRAGSEVALTITPESVMGDDGSEFGQIGAANATEFSEYPDFMIRELEYGPVAAVGKSLSYAWSRIELTILSIAKMVTGKISLENLSGPITIAKVAGDSASPTLPTRPPRKF